MIIFISSRKGKLLGWEICSVGTVLVTSVRTRVQSLEPTFEEAGMVAHTNNPSTGRQKQPGAHCSALG